MRLFQWSLLDRSTHLSTHVEKVSHGNIICYLLFISSILSYSYFSYLESNYNL